jgi:hypothetical protein
MAAPTKVNNPNVEVLINHKQSALPSENTLETPGRPNKRRTPESPGEAFSLFVYFCIAIVDSIIKIWRIMIPLAGLINPTTLLCLSQSNGIVIGICHGHDFS